MTKANRIIAFLSLFAAGACAAQEPATAAKIAAIFANADSGDAPGYAVAVALDGKVVFEKTYGLASVEYGAPFTPSTPFNTASLSKQFAGLAVSILVQQGKVGLDDDIRKYLPELPQYAEGKVTVRQLLHHTSGIRDCYAVLVAAGWRWDDAFTADDCMRTAIAQKGLAFAPGTRYAYSNTEYRLLQAIVAAAGGQPFPQWTKENIFRPIGMDSTYFVDDYSKIVRNAAMPYSRGGGVFRRDLQQDSGVYMLSTLRDLTRWAIHFDRRLAAKDPVYLRMTEPGALADGGKVPYGFGLMLDKDRGLDIVFHTGAWGGYRANIRLYPARHLSVVALNNAGDNDMNPKKVPQVAALFLGEGAGPPGKAASLRDVPTVKPAPALLRGYAGLYRWKDDAIVISVEGDRLMSQYLGEEKVPAEAKSDTEFWVPAYRAPIYFSKKNGAPVLVFRSGEGEQVEPFVPGALEAYAGTYYNDDLAAQYRVEAKDGKLSMRHFRRGDAVLTPHPAYSDRFTGDMGTVQFVEDGGEVVGFDFVGENLGRLRFAKKR
ncbi:beta-lactamase family protein [Luteimonas gilva]|uniref:Beta-lactamase family protein n=1 Tax=Luteimonas gilva TaxID=2572684 RepID=A0A4U5JVW7_9GAMM|nr:serine hydrolase domain-containing protein [Luteimonas gilva]TKR32791.1 beta-lactamase family protein [Luteimonas gilva]